MKTRDIVNLGRRRFVTGSLTSVAGCLRTSASSGGAVPGRREGRLGGAIGSWPGSRRRAARVVQFLRRDVSHVDRVVIAVDCGIAINPDVVEVQMQGGMGSGLSAALLSQLTLKDGLVEQSNFHDYQVLRIDQMPEVEVYTVPSADPPTGVGEPATPVIAPAVANAVFTATGQRLRQLPLRLA